MRRSRGLLQLGLVAVGSMLSTGSPTPALQPAQIGAGAAIVDERALDLATPACRNFYRHACGGFMASAKPTDNRAEFSLFDDAFDARLRAELDQLFREPAAQDSELGRLKTFYASCRRSMTAGSADDTTLLRKGLARIEGAKTRSALMAVSRDLDTIGVEPFLVFDVTPDPAGWTHWHGSPSPADPFGEAAKVQRMFELAGSAEDRAARDAARVAAIATGLDNGRKANADPDRKPAQLTWAESRRWHRT